MGSNLLAGPGLQHPVRRVLPAGTAVTVSAQTPDGSWLQLQDGSWIFAALVQPLPEPPPPAAAWDWHLSDSDNLRQVHLAEINALRPYHGLGT